MSGSRCARAATTLLLVLLGSAVHLSAAIALPQIFGDRMVLQRDKPAPVWGTAAAGANVVVEFAGQTKTVTTAADGSWRVVLDPLAASAEPRELIVDTKPAAPARVVIADVLVGEVWLCSGQSNMFWPVGRVSNARSNWPGVQDGEAEVDAARWPSIRLNCADDHELGPGGWQVCSPASVRGFSATAYFFGRELHRQLGVPVGLINRSIGGTSVQAWTPKRELEALPFVQQNARLLETSQDRIQQWNRAFADFRKAVNAGTTPRPIRPAALPDEIEVARKLQNHGELHQRHIAPLVPFAIRGFTWYQGESNASPRALAAAYGEMLGLLIAGWRGLWGDANLPFYFVQLPIFNKPAAGEHWHIVRESMRRLHQTTPHTGMAVTYDFCDPTNLHPPEKQEVGRRLALWALARSYGKSVAFSGPLLREVRYQDRKAVLVFDHADGLQSRDGARLRGFELAADDGRFFPASAEIEGATVLVQAEPVASPRHARFFFGGLEPPNLVNGARLPASPFTTTETYGAVEMVP